MKRNCSQENGSVINKECFNFSMEGAEIWDCGLGWMGWVWDGVVIKFFFLLIERQVEMIHSN